MRRYRVRLPVMVDGEYGQGDEFEKEMTETEEAAAVSSGLLEIVPATYKVVGDTRLVFGNDVANPGDTFEQPLTIAQEKHLTDAGHIERVEKPKTAAKTTKKKED